MLIYNVTYKGVNYTLKQNINSIFIFEEVTGKLYNLKTTYDLVINIYSLFRGNGHEIDFNEFLEFIDNDFNFINQFYESVIHEPDKKKAPETGKKK
jgi:hypothetical protein